MAKWEAEFNQLMSGQREDPDADYGAAMQSAWETGLGDYNNTTGGPETRQFDAGGTPLLGDYAFGEHIPRYIGCSVLDVDQNPITNSWIHLDPLKRALSQPPKRC